MSVYQCIKDIYKRVVPKKIQKPILPMMLFFLDKDRYIYTKYWSKKKIEMGRLNPDKKIYVLRRIPTGAGLLTCYLTHLSTLELIMDKGYHPIVDMKTHYYSMIHNCPEDEGKVNAWEMFFEQFSDISIEEAYKSRNVTLGSGFMSDNGSNFKGDVALSDEELQKWHNIDKKYMKFKDSLLEQYKNEYDRLLADKRVIGFSIRDAYVKLSDFKMEVVGGHPVQPSVEFAIRDINRYLKKWNCDHVFISTESNQTLEIMKESFGDKLLYIDRVRRDMNTENEDEFRNATRQYFKNTTNQQRTVSYLKEVYLMSRCTCLLGGKSSSTIVACIWNGCKYENRHIYRLGEY